MEIIIVVIILFVLAITIVSVTAALKYKARAQVDSVELSESDEIQKFSPIMKQLSTISNLLRWLIFWVVLFMILFFVCSSWEGILKFAGQ